MYIFILYEKISDWQDGLPCDRQWQSFSCRHSELTFLMYWLGPLSASVFCLGFLSKDTAPIWPSVCHLSLHNETRLNPCQFTFRFNISRRTANPEHFLLAYLILFLFNLIFFYWTDSVMILYVFSVSASSIYSCFISHALLSSYCDYIVAIKIIGWEWRVKGKWFNSVLLDMHSYSIGMWLVISYYFRVQECQHQYFLLSDACHKMLCIFLLFSCKSNATWRLPAEEF